MDKPMPKLPYKARLETCRNLIELADEHAVSLRAVAFYWRQFVRTAEGFIENQKETRTG